MHFNLAWPDDAANRYDGDAVRVVRDQIYQLAVGDFGGSYSDEHGIGPHNVAWYRKFTAPAALGLSARLQGMLDPHRLCGVVDLGPSLETA
jgi:FAD/FMN-containing dehydrogenase